MPQELVRNEMIRLLGWSGFRSRSRERIVPLTSHGAVSQRIRINEAVPVSGVGVGEAVISAEEQRAAAQAEMEMSVRLRDQVVRGSQGTGQRQFVWASVGGAPAPATVIGSNRFTLFNAPADGYIVGVTVNINSNATRVAVRTSGGASLFIGAGGTNNAGQAPTLEPDYIDDTQPQLWQGYENVRVAVLAGEEIYLVADFIVVVGPGVYLGHTQMVFEYAVGNVSQSTRFAADFSEVRVAMRQQAASTARADSDRLRLEIERERTRRAQIEAGPRS